MRDFSDLTEREILALAIANEEEDSRIYLDIAEGLRAHEPVTARAAEGRAVESRSSCRRRCSAAAPPEE